MAAKGRRSVYEEWAEEEGIPILLTYGGTDLTTMQNLFKELRIAA